MARMYIMIPDAISTATMPNIQVSVDGPVFLLSAPSVGVGLVML